MILSGLKYYAGRMVRSIAVVAAAAALTMMSCSQDTPDAPTGEDQAGVVAFRMVAFKNAATPASRATQDGKPDWGDTYPEQGGNDFETAILKNQLYVVITDASCSQEYAVTNLTCKKTTETPLTVTYEYTGRVEKDHLGDIARLTDGKLHIIANAGFDAQLADKTVFSHYGQPDGNFTAIPMWGVKTVNFSTISPDAPLEVGDVSLLRSMAKVVIENASGTGVDNYIKTLKSVTVSAVNTQGYLLPQDWTGIKETENLPRNAIRIPEQQTIPVTYDFIDNRVEFYLPEMLNPEENEIALNLTFDTNYPGDPGLKYTLLENWKRIDRNYDDSFSWDGPYWSSTTAIKSTSCTRFATTMNGKLYTVNMKTMSIMEVDGNGSRDVYKLPKLSGSDYYGTAISHDDAGNFLIGHYFAYAQSAYIWTVYSPATGKAKHITLSLPSGYTAARIDCVGRVEGDLTRDAVVHIAPSSGNKVLTVKFKGNGDADGITATCTATAAKQMTTTTFCQPVGKDSFAYYSKSDNRIIIYNIGGNTSSANIYTSFTNLAGTNGFETFVLGGKRYYVVNYLPASNSNNSNPMDIAVFDENGKICATWSNPDYNSKWGYSSISVQKLDDSNVEIFVYNCTSDLNGSGAIAAASVRFSVFDPKVERTSALYLRPYTNGEPDTTKSPYDIRRNYLYNYKVNMISPVDLSVIVDVVPYKSVELNPDFGFDDFIKKDPTIENRPPIVIDPNEPNP